MMLRRCFCLCLIVLGVTGTRVPVQAQDRKMPIPTDRELARYNLVRAWWNQAVIDPRRDTIAHITADEVAVFVQSTSGVVTAIDAETGKTMWSRMFGSPDRATLPVKTNDEMVFLASGMKLYAIHKASGEPLWTVDLPHHPSTSPEVDETHIYIGTVEGSVYAYDLSELNRLFQERLLPNYIHQARLWRYQAPSEIVSPPVSNGEAVVFASFSGLLYSVSTSDRSLYYQFETADREPIRVPMGRSNQTVFVASDDANVFALDMINGARRWVFTAGEPIRLQPRVVGNHVFVTAGRRGTFCLRTTTGFEQWHQVRAREFLAATPDIVYASDKVQNLLILDREDGSIRGILPYRTLPIRVNNERTDRLYLATKGGLVVCIRERGRETPIWHLYPDRQPIRPELAPEPPEPSPPSAEVTDENGAAP